MKAAMEVSVLDGSNRRVSYSWGRRPDTDSWLRTTALKQWVANFARYSDVDSYLVIETGETIQWTFCLAKR